MIKLILLAVIETFKQLFLVPQNVANALREKRRKSTLNDLEAERLDRIRNPSNYRGR